MTPKDLPSGGYAKDAAEIEGYVRGFARRRPDVAVTVAAVRQLHRPAHRHRASPGTSRCRSCPPCSATTPACSCCTRRTRSRCWSARPADDLPGVFNVGRRRRAAAVPGHPPCRVASRLPVPERRRRAGRAASVRGARAGRLLARADAAAQLRPGGRHHPAAQRSSASPRAGPPRRPSTTTCAAARCARCSARSGSRRSSAACWPPPGRCDDAAPTGGHRAQYRRRPRDRRGAGRPPMPEARVIPLHADEAGGRTRRRARAPPPRTGPRRPAPRPSSRHRDGTEPTEPEPPAWEEALAEALAFLRRRLERRLRGRRVRVRPRPHRQRAAARAAPAVPDSGSGWRPSACTTCRTTAARWSSPTTPAPCRSTR